LSRSPRQQKVEARRGRGQRAPGDAIGLLGARRQVGDQAGLVDLHPGGTRLGQDAHRLGIGRQQRRQQVERMAAVLGLGQKQERDGAEQSGPRARASATWPRAPMSW